MKVGLQMVMPVLEKDPKDTSGLGRGKGGGGVVVYQYTWKKFAKIPKIHPNIPKINGTIVYYIPEIQRKWYTEYPY